MLRRLSDWDRALTRQALRRPALWVGGAMLALFAIELAVKAALGADPVASLPEAAFASAWLGVVAVILLKRGKSR